MNVFDCVVVTKLNVKSNDDNKATMAVLLICIFSPVSGAAKAATHQDFLVTLTVDSVVT